MNLVFWFCFMETRVFKTRIPRVFHMYLFSTSNCQHIELESLKLDLQHYTQVCETRDASLLNSLKTLLTNKIVSKMVLFCKKKKKKFPLLMPLLVSILTFLDEIKMKKIIIIFLHIVKILKLSTTF